MAGQPISGKPMTPDRAIATLLLSIDQELSAKVLRQFSDDAVDRITRAMQELQELAIDRDCVRQAMSSAVQPRERSFAGLSKPCKIGPMAVAPASRSVNL